MKVSILVSHSANRYHQLERSLFFLEHQTYPNYEVWIMDDGSDGIPKIRRKDIINYRRLRPKWSTPRSPNTAFRLGYEMSNGSFVILMNSEHIIPLDAVEVMVKRGAQDRRNVPIQYHLSRRQLREIDKMSTTKVSAELHSVMKFLPNFFDTRTPWGYTNSDAKYHREHFFAFSGQARRAWDKIGFLPDTEEWLMPQEETPPVPIEIEIYHQTHPIMGVMG